MEIPQASHTYHSVSLRPPPDSTPEPPELVFSRPWALRRRHSFWKRCSAAGCWTSSKRGPKSGGAPWPSGRNDFRNEASRGEREVAGRFNLRLMIGSKQIENIEIILSAGYLL